MRACQEKLDSMKKNELGAKLFEGKLLVFAITSEMLKILMEHIEMKKSLDSKLQIYSICSIRIRSRNWDIFEKPQYYKFARIPDAAMIAM